MDAAFSLPELASFKGMTVRWFLARQAEAFQRLPPAARRMVPAVIRRLYASAAQHVADGARCLICDGSAGEGRVLVAVAAGGGFEFGGVCARCASWGLGVSGHNLWALSNATPPVVNL
jgi:hypothetical protein